MSTPIRKWGAISPQPKVRAGELALVNTARLKASLHQDEDGQVAELRRMFSLDDPRKENQ